MSILDQLLAEMRLARGPIRSTALAARLGTSPAALEGMIEVLTAKGVLAGAADETVTEPVACSGVACGTSCVGLAACPFIADIPTTYTLVIEV